MAAEFMTKMGMTVPEDMENMPNPWAFMNGKRFECGPRGEKPWNKKRAIVVSQPTDVLEACPGQTLLPAISIKNGAHWAWKTGVFLGMEDSVELANLPIEVVNVPITFKTEAMETFKMNVPIKIHESAVASDDVHKFALTFRGPNGNQFGEVINLKLRVVPQQMQAETTDEPKTLSEIETLKLAIKLHESLNSGQSFDECL
jgi:hypothetical protein